MAHTRLVKVLVDEYTFCKLAPVYFTYYVCVCVKCVNCARTRVHVHLISSISVFYYPDQVHHLLALDVRAHLRSVVHTLLPHLLLLRLRTSKAPCS